MRLDVDLVGAIVTWASYDLWWVNYPTWHIIMPIILPHITLIIEHQKPNCLWPIIVMIFIKTPSHDFGYSVSGKPLISVTPVLLRATTKSLIVYTLANYIAAMVHVVPKRPVATFLSTCSLDYEIVLFHDENVVSHTIMVAISRVPSCTLCSIPVCLSKRAENSPIWLKSTLSFTGYRVHTPKFGATSFIKSYILSWLGLIAQSGVWGVTVVHNYCSFRASWVR